MRLSWLITLAMVLALCAAWWALRCARRGQSGASRASCPSCGHELPNRSSPRCSACGESL
ncbi:MAG: hypothetical protein DCC66_05145 [Planctomycetota bacterium]|nr:MAG: hypothetical protein DCC66_05145 [Planctomycetota bacterium]